MTQVSEIVGKIYRLGTMPAGKYPVGFNQFLIDDERPTLIHTGFYDSYEAVRTAVSQVLDPKRLAYVVLGPFESDECGELRTAIGVMDAPSWRPARGDGGSQGGKRQTRI